ncbi:MAG TPA: SRPBCC domain-containing protein [Chitinophagaceae bacterium]|nr:SRPBCC domain-containing protein [Chitinophagaceae bacterium]
MKTYNWTGFTKRVPINAPAKTIYDAWTTQHGLEKWFLRLAQFTSNHGTLRGRYDQIAPGDRYRWLWHGYSDDVVESQEILSVNGWDGLSFRFSGGCIVTVTLMPEKGQTICELKQHMPMDDVELQRYYFIECGLGWSFYLVNLKSVLEGGLDLRNRNADLREVVTA